MRLDKSCCKPQVAGCRQERRKKKPQVVSHKKKPEACSLRPAACKIGITLGDAAGIGPEVILKALSSKKFKKTKFLIIGDKKVIQNTIDRLKISLVSQAAILDLSNINFRFTLGKTNQRLGKAAVECIEKGVRLAQEERIDALVTAPISKQAINSAGCNYPGHTQLLAHLTGAKDTAMMFSGPLFKVVLATTHLPLKGVSCLLTSQRIYKVIKLTAVFLKKYFNTKPKIAIAGFNPHAGEDGLLGSEEKEIKKAVQKAHREGIKAEGPLPPDVLFHQIYSKKYEVAVAMYHDQGLIPFKMLSFDKGVNITLGLPIIRTSPDHGTGFDIAGKGIANPQSMIEAIKMAEFLSRKK